MRLSKELYNDRYTIILSNNLQIERRNTSLPELHCPSVKQKTGLNADTIFPGINIISVTSLIDF